MRRFGSLIRVRPDKREEYLRLHAAVWPEVQATISACGIRNYTIFMHGDLLFGYYEYTGDDHAADLARMAADPATQRWWALTDPCQEQVAGTAPGQWWASMTEVWHQD
ncbi:MAG TPA: L-rhamnose mutarotase [Catenuloplanes sp.]|jgi:L-rhamnose mutarotase